MTENEAVEALRLINTSRVHPFYSWEEMAEVRDIAISALKEIQQYREIGTVEECRKAKRFKEYFDELYGIGLEVANWHQNGNTEPFDNFYDAAIDWSEQNER